MQALSEAWHAQRPNAFQPRLCKATSRDGNGGTSHDQPRRAAGQRQPGDFRTRSDKRDGDSSPMAAAEAPELQDRGDRGSGDLSRAPPLPRCAQISGGPARNRVVFINGRRLKGVIYPSRETATGSASTRPGQRNPIARRFPFTRARTTQVDENHPIPGRTPPENASPRTRCYLSCSSRCRRKEKPPPRRSCKGSSKQFIMATGALEKGNAVI